MSQYTDYSVAAGYDDPHVAECSVRKETTTLLV